MNKKVAGTALAIVVVTAAGIVVAQQGNAKAYHAQTTMEQQSTIDSTFNNLQQNTSGNGANTTENDVLLVKGDGFTISVKDFEFYKANVDMLMKLNQLQQVGEEVGNQPELDNTTLLQQLLKTELAVQYAKKIGIVVSEQEMTHYTKQQKDHLYDSSLQGSNQELIQSIMDKRIKITGLTKTQFWNSEAVKQQYGKMIYMNKLYEFLSNQGQITGPASFDTFQDQLVREQINHYTVDTERLNRM